MFTLCNFSYDNSYVLWRQRRLDAGKWVVGVTGGRREGGGTVGAEEWVVGVMVGEAGGRGVEVELGGGAVVVGSVELFGLGQTISWQWGGQNSLILVKRYSFRSRDRPGGLMTGGISLGEGAH